MNGRHSRQRFAPMGSRRNSRGVGLIEVMIAILILAIGFLALAQLQTAATRSAAEARARTASVNLATDKLEELRAFLGRAGDADGDGDPDLIVDEDGDGIGDADGLAFDGIVSGNDTPDEVGTGTRGYEFTRTWTSTPCTIDREGALACGGTITAATADFLRVAVEVEWVNAEGTSTNPNQRVIVEDLISSSTPLDAAVALSQPVTNRERPKVYIQPSRIQSTIPIAIGDGLDSAASDPQPTIIRDNIVRTQFEVLTFSTDENGLLAERIFDYTVVGCECELNDYTDGEEMLEPTVWNGLTFTRPRQVTNGEAHPSPAVTGVVNRVTGTAIVRNNDPPLIKDLCNSCCRDHHDTVVTSTPKLDPTRPASEYLSNGDHRHYLPVLNGINYNFVEATAPGDPYYETCRFLRRDGIYRLTLDAHLVDLAVFRQRDLDSTDETDAYAVFARQLIQSYVNRAAAVGSTYPNFDANTQAAIYADGKANITDTSFLAKLDPTTPYALPQPGVQLLSRGIYVDYMTPEVLSAVRCKINNTPDLPACLPYRDVELLELVPFFAVGMTRLNNWRPEDPAVLTLDLTDRTDAFSRGFAVPRRDGATNAISTSPISNIGLTNPVPGSALESSLSISDRIPFTVGGVIDPEDPPRTVVFEIERARNTGLDSAGVVQLMGTGGACVSSGAGNGQNSASRWECALRSDGSGAVVFSAYTGTECIDRQGQTCITFGFIRNRLCFAPQPPAVASTTPSDARLDTTTVTFNGTQPSTANYAVSVIPATQTCPGSDAYPGVTAISPANGATDVLPNANVAIAFSEPVNATADAVTLTCNGGPNLVTGGTAASNVSTLTVAHDPMPFGANCTLTVIGANITDADTIDPPDQMGSNVVVTFQTAALVDVDTPPTVTGTTPGNGTTSILTNQALTVNFSEAVNATAGSVTLSCNGGANLITGGTTGSNVTVLNPTHGGMPSGANCVMTVLAANITDVDTNDPPNAMASNYVSTFAVANVLDSAPTVASVVPLTGSNITRDTAITVNFSELVNVTANSVTFVCNGTNREGSVTFQTLGAGPTSYTQMTINQPNGGNIDRDVCTLTVLGGGVTNGVTDSDSIDPPDNMAATFTATFNGPP